MHGRGREKPTGMGQPLLLFPGDTYVQSKSTPHPIEENNRIKLFQSPIGKEALKLWIKKYFKKYTFLVGL